MTAFRKPWPGLSGMLNAIHPQGYLWRQSPFGICLCFIFLNACITPAERKKMKVTPGASQTLPLCAHCPAVEGCRTWLCSAMNGCDLKGPYQAVFGLSVQRVVLSLDRDQAEVQSEPGANAKHLNVKSVISIPKSLNIEIRSSVQQRPIFTLIYHGCPCTQGLITPYMVNKPLPCSRQCVMFAQRQRVCCTVTVVSQCLCQTTFQGKTYTFTCYVVVK